MNEHGFLPKADPADLDEGTRRRLERWRERAYDDDNLFLTLARRPGLFDAVMGFVRYIYGGGSTVEARLFEPVRIKLAWQNHCFH